MAQETYLTLVRKLDESEVAAQDASGSVRVAVPRQSMLPRKGVNTILAGSSGLMVGVLLAFVVDARESRKETSTVPAPQI